jgi:hypothetical protein
MTDSGGKSVKRVLLGFQDDSHDVAEAFARVIPRLGRPQLCASFFLHEAFHSVVPGCRCYWREGRRSHEQVYMQAIRENIRVAGDTCSRDVILGAILAAATDGPPQKVRRTAKVDTNTAAEMNAAADAIANQALAGTSAAEEL